MDSVDGYDMERLGRGVVWYGAPAPAEILFYPEKIPPSGVVYFPERHLAHKIGGPPGGGGPIKSLLPALFKVANAELLMQGITRLSFNQAGLVITNLTLSIWENWAASCIITGHLFAALRGWTEIKTWDHAMILQEIQGRIWHCHVQDTHTDLEETMVSSPVLYDCQLIQGTKKGTLLAVLPSTIN